MTRHGCAKRGEKYPLYKTWLDMSAVIIQQLLNINL